MPMEEGICLDELAKKTEFYSGADIKSLCREAALEACRRNMESTLIQKRDFDKALQLIGPSLSLEMLEKYECIQIQNQKK